MNCKALMIIGFILLFISGCKKKDPTLITYEVTTETNGFVLYWETETETKEKFINRRDTVIEFFIDHESEFCGRVIIHSVDDPKEYECYISRDHLVTERFIGKLNFGHSAELNECN